MAILIAAALTPAIMAAACHCLTGDRALLPSVNDKYRLNPTYEEEEKAVANLANVVIFKKSKRIQIAGLLRPIVGNDLYWTAMRSERVKLREVGKFYHELVTTNLI